MPDRTVVSWSYLKRIIASIPASRDVRVAGEKVQFYVLDGDGDHVVVHVGQVDAQRLVATAAFVVPAGRFVAGALAANSWNGLPVAYGTWSYAVPMDGTTAVALESVLTVGSGAKAGQIADWLGGVLEHVDAWEQTVLPVLAAVPTDAQLIPPEPARGFVSTRGNGAGYGPAAGLAPSPALSAGRTEPDGFDWGALGRAGLTVLDVLTSL
jgi:hypothetical protein